MDEPRDLTALWAENLELRAENQALRAEHEAAKLEHTLGLALFEHAPVAIEVYDQDGYATWLNQAQLDFLGVPDPAIVIGKFNVLTDPESVSQGFADLYRRAYAGEVVHMPEMQMDLAAFASNWKSSVREPWFDGLVVPLRDESGEVVGVASFVHEITKSKLAEEMVLAADRYKRLAMLANGIAHDFNNLLMAIATNAGMGLEVGVDIDAARQLFERILKATEQAARLPRQLLAYAGKDQPRRTTFDLGHVVAEMVEVLRAVLPRGVVFEYDDGGNGLWVFADEVQVQQLLLNLVTNAGEAIGDRGHGHVRVRLSACPRTNVPLDTQLDFTESSDPGERLVCLEVHDDGCGMDAFTRAHLFDPFFSTRPEGHGLGMASLLGIVRGHHGAIRVDSSEGRGTSIVVSLPEADRSIGDVAESVVEVTAPLCILVADDEDIIRLVAARTLARRGHEILLASDGREAIEIFTREHARIDLVVLDLAMPEMGGDDVTRAIRSVAPALPILITSGLDEQSVIGRLIDGPHLGYLQKPFRGLDLVDAVEAVMASVASAPALP